MLTPPNLLESHTLKQTSQTLSSTGQAPLRGSRAHVPSECLWPRPPRASLTAHAAPTASFQHFSWSFRLSQPFLSRSACPCAALARVPSSSFSQDSVEGSKQRFKLSRSSAGGAKPRELSAFPRLQSWPSQQDAVHSFICDALAVQHQPSAAGSRTAIHATEAMEGHVEFLACLLALLAPKDDQHPRGPFSEQSAKRHQPWHATRMHTTNGVKVRNATKKTNSDACLLISNATSTSGQCSRAFKSSASRCCCAAEKDACRKRLWRKCPGRSSNSRRC